MSALYRAFHQGGRYCNSAERVWISDGTLEYDNKVIAWHEGSKDYFYVRLPKISLHILRVLRTILPEGYKDFVFKADVLYIVHKTGAIESSDLTFGDMNGIF